MVLYRDHATQDFAAKSHREMFAMQCSPFQRMEIELKHCGKIPRVTLSKRVKNNEKKSFFGLLIKK